MKVTYDNKLVYIKMGIYACKFSRAVWMVVNMQASS